MLEHLRVLEVAGFGTAICGQIFGDLGADVVVVEPPGGAELRRRPPFYENVPHPDRSLPWWAYNRNKRGVTLDLATAAGQAQFRRLAAEADFVLEGQGPGDSVGMPSMESLGLGYERLAAANPRLIMVSTSPFGLDGPKAHWLVSDIVIMASSTVLSLTGDADRAPLRISVPQAHLHAGAEAAATAMIAHQGRVKTGRGQHLDVSAQQAVTMATQCNILAAAWHDPRSYLSRVADDIEARLSLQGWLRLLHVLLRQRDRPGHEPADAGAARGGLRRRLAGSEGLRKLRQLAVQRTGTAL